MCERSRVQYPSTYDIILFLMAKSVHLYIYIYIYIYIYYIYISFVLYPFVLDPTGTCTHSFRIVKKSLNRVY